ncbi:MAG TPA: M24 family metallopeptidase [Terriglobales bacterium]|jgi:Xaa-Pro aminopeptidase
MQKDMTEIEAARVRELQEAQAKAEALFHEIETRKLIREGILESHLNNKIYSLAQEMYGIITYWHKRIVRAGNNTLLPYAENPPDRVIAQDDILFLDLGPVFENWEADFGRTFVIGDDPLKEKLRSDTEEAFAAGKRHFQASPEITASELFEHVAGLAENSGWEFGGVIAGHLIGHFPHERFPDDKISLYIHPKNHTCIRTQSSDGLMRHWILEVHFVDRKHQIGAFFEELLTI